MRKTRRIEEKRNMSVMYSDVYRRVQRGLITVSEYREIENDLLPLYNFETVTTISEKVKDFFQMFGVHVEKEGIGYALTWY